MTNNTLDKYQYLGDQMTIEEMEDRFKTFSEDDWDSYGCPATTPEVISMLKELWLRIGRPSWFVAYSNGADMVYDIYGDISLEVSVSADGTIGSLVVERRNRDDKANDWARFVAEREAWQRYGVENIPHEV